LKESIRVFKTDIYQNPPITISFELKKDLYYIRCIDVDWDAESARNGCNKADTLFYIADMRTPFSEEYLTIFTYEHGLKEVQWYGALGGVND